MGAMASSVGADRGRACCMRKAQNEVLDRCGSLHSAHTAALHIDYDPYDGTIPTIQVLMLIEKKFAITHFSLEAS